MKVWFLLGALIILASCGEDTLNLEQKGQLKSLIESAQSPIEASMGSYQKQGGTEFASSLNVLMANTRKPASDKMATFQAALKEGDCKIAEPQMSSGASPFGTTKIQVGGSNCPIDLYVAVDILGSQSWGSVKFDAKYSLNDTSLKSLNDVIGFDISGQIGMKIGEQEISGEIKGLIVSQAHGNVEVEVQAEGNQEESKFEMKFAFSDFDARLTMVLKEGTARYFIQDEEVSAEEFSEFGLGTMGTVSPKPDAEGSSQEVQPAPESTDFPETLSY